MKRTLTLIVLSICTLLFAVQFVSAQDPGSLEEMYGATEEYYALQAQMDQILESEQRSGEERQRGRTLVLIVSIVAALVPLGYLTPKIIREKTWKTNPGGTVRAIFVGLAGGVVLFAFNFGIFTLKEKYGQGFNIVLAYLLVAALIVGVIYLLRKKN